DSTPTAQNRHQEAPRPTGIVQGDPAIATQALMEKGLIPEGFRTEPQIIALRSESTIIPIRLGHDDIPFIATGQSVVVNSGEGEAFHTCRAVGHHWEDGGMPCI